TPYHLTVALGRYHVHAKRQIRSLRNRFHVERSHRGRITMNHHRPVKMIRQITLVRCTKISAPLEPVLELALCVSFLEHCHRIVVLQSRKRYIDLFQFRNVPFELREFLSSILQYAMHYERDELFCQMHRVVEVSVGYLGFHHPEL